MINIKTDSRKVKKGDIFVALRGISSDGHDYIDKAISLGASKLIVMDDGNYNIPYELVDDTRVYLNNYLVENYKSILDKMTIIGYTGTNGKTTCAYLMQDALNKLGVKCAYIGTIGYYLDEFVCSLPNTSPDVCDMYELILNAYNKGFKTIAIEASSQGLDIGRLYGIPFNYAIFTNLTQDHLDYHKTMENYADAKKILFNQLKPNGLRIINNDDPSKNHYIEGNTITFGIKSGDYQATNINYKSIGTDFLVNGLNINSPLLGDYNVYNLLPNIIILKELNFDNKQIEDVIKTLSCPSGRMDTIIYKNNSIIIDYAHTPDAIEKIIATVKKVVKGEIYVVFGCTGSRDKSKRPIMTKLVLNNVKKAIITIDDPHDELPAEIVKDMLEGCNNTNYEIELNRGLAIKKGIELLKENDTLLILGKGHEEVIIIGKEKIPFNDKKKVIEIIGE